MHRRDDGRPEQADRERRDDVGGAVPAGDDRRGAGERRREARRQRDQRAHRRRARRAAPRRRHSRPRWCDRSGRLLSAPSPKSGRSRTTRLSTWVVTSAPPITTAAPIASRGLARAAGRPRRRRSRRGRSRRSRRSRARSATCSWVSRPATTVPIAASSHCCPCGDCTRDPHHHDQRRPPPRQRTDNAGRAVSRRVTVSWSSLYDARWGPSPPWRVRQARPRGRLGRPSDIPEPRWRVSAVVTAAVLSLSGATGGRDAPPGNCG